MSSSIMASPHPAAMYWGDEYIAIYNEVHDLLSFILGEDKKLTRVGIHTSGRSEASTVNGNYHFFYNLYPTDGYLESRANVSTGTKL